MCYTTTILQSIGMPDITETILHFRSCSVLKDEPMAVKSLTLNWNNFPFCSAITNLCRELSSLTLHVCLSSNLQVFLSLPVIQKYKAPLLHSLRLPRYLGSLEVCYVKSVCVCLSVCECVILCVLIFGTAFTNHSWGPKH